ncbi:MAG: NADH-quinone oxidoreductase subunit C [Bacteroidales bacterium]|jgi:Ni,Fe-hydrogenase III large subunit
MTKIYYEITSNPSSIKLTDIPVLSYSEFQKTVDELMSVESNHCLNYFAFPLSDKYKFVCCIGDDETKKIIILSHEQPKTKDISLESITAKHFQFHVFEREIYENYGIYFSNHPWLKPIRYPFNRSNLENKISNYPFYSIDSEELHEVGVGPIHAGIIEPGYFRFICNGENVLHLEIHLGFQHRGIEQLFLEKQSVLQQTILAESIAGDTTIAHSIAYSLLAESLANKTISEELSIERTIALELERIAIHIGDTAALCTDVAYQLGQVINEALRTIIINTNQFWCGNRFGKGLIRTCGSHYPLTKEIIEIIKNNLNEVEQRYLQITDRIFTLPSVLARFETIGKVTKKQASMIGAVGIGARSSGLKRDTRWSHPFLQYDKINYEPIVLPKGDVWSRAMLRKMEVLKSVAIIKELLNKYDNEKIIDNPNYDLKFEPYFIAISMVEGWRGEICHTAITDNKGKIIHYKIKDPSLHNWMALALAVRGQEISDFPVCNKSYNLSYCGNDL